MKLPLIVSYPGRLELIALAWVGMTLEVKSPGTFVYITKCSHAIQEAVEKGVNPEKSLKRKREEAELEEFQRQKKELERAKSEKQQQEAREKVFHPISGQVVYLTEGERQELFKSLNLMKKGDVAMGSLPVPHAAPPSSYPPMMPHGMPPVGSLLCALLCALLWAQKCAQKWKQKWTLRALLAHKSAHFCVHFCGHFCAHFCLHFVFGTPLWLGLCFVHSTFACTLSFGVALFSLLADTFFWTLDSTLSFFFWWLVKSRVLDRLFSS